MAYQIDRVEKREKKHRKARQGMQIHGKSIFVILAIEVKRAEELKKKKRK